MSKLKYIKVAIDSDVIQILEESCDGCLASNIEEAVRHWSSCGCKANIREGKLELCDYCKAKEQDD